jgi:hypothetical protein
MSNEAASPMLVFAVLAIVSDRSCALPAAKWSARLLEWTGLATGSAPASARSVFSWRHTGPLCSFRRGVAASPQLLHHRIADPRGGDVGEHGRVCQVRRRGVWHRSPPRFLGVELADVDPALGEAIARWRVAGGDAKLASLGEARKLRVRSRLLGREDGELRCRSMRPTGAPSLCQPHAPGERDDRDRS